jgi:hypothetical protein
VRSAPARLERRAWQLTAAATAVLLLVPAAVYGWSWIGHSTGTTDIELHHPVTAIRLDVPDGSVVLRPGPADEVRLHATRAWTLREPEVEQRWDGSTLTIRVTDPGPAVDGLAPSVALELRVPATVAVDARTSAGSIDLAQLQGDLRLETESGSVTVADAGGGLRLHSVSGAIRTTGLRSRTVDVRAESGAVGLEFATPPDRVSASIGSGDLRVVVPPSTGYRVTGAGPNGGVRAAAGLNDPTANRSIDVSLDGGSATLGY